MPRHLTFVATTSRGFEPLLVKELRRVGLQRVHEERGAVRFHGRMRDGYTACLRSRLASRVLLRVGRFEVRDAEQLYDGTREVCWADHIGQGQTFAVRFTGTSRAIRDTRFGTLRVKDAIVDQLREQRGTRPDIDPRDPSVRVHAHLRDGVVTMFIDLSGRPLHERGGQREAGPAPMRETLAAALLYLADWPRRARAGEAFLDPMCGGGTLVAEAAAMATGRDPGLLRQHWGFERWHGHTESVWQTLLDEAQQRAAQPQEHGTILGTDIDGLAVGRAGRWLSRLGLAQHAEVAQADMREISPPPRVAGLVVTNPPYGERLGEEEEVTALYRDLGQTLKRFHGWHAWIITNEVRWLRQLKMKPEHRSALFNGQLRCEVASYPIR